MWGVFNIYLKCNTELQRRIGIGKVDFQRLGNETQRKTENNLIYLYL